MNLCKYWTDPLNSVDFTLELRMAVFPSSYTFSHFVICSWAIILIIIIIIIVTSMQPTINV